MAALTVSLAERSYPIYIQAGVLQRPERILQHIRSEKVVIVTNDVVKALYAQALLDVLKDRDCSLISLPDGEAHKNLQQFESIVTQLLEFRAARDTTLVALGGGVIGDITGFVAATYQRGIDFIQVPTTLLAQVDSSVGGKTAVNHPLGKNMIGAFYQPKAVLIDPLSLNTLPPREFAAGMAEVIKYGIIYDSDFFNWLEQNHRVIKAQQADALAYMLRRCCAIKAEIVAQDEREAGIRALLNLGHTFGHAIEAEQGYGSWLHGEAVAVGIMLACIASEALGWFEASQTRRIYNLLRAFELPVVAPAEMNYDIFMRHMRLDKKVSEGKIAFILPRNIGKACVTKALSEQILRSILD